MMESFLEFIFVLAAVKYCLSAALTRRVWLMALYGAVMAVAAFAIYPVVIGWRGDMAERMLANGSVVADAALLITVEAAAGIFVSVFVLDNYFMPSHKRRLRVFVLKVLPGVVCFFAAAYFESLFFRSFAGVEFAAGAAIYSCMLFAAVFGGSVAVSRLMPGESVKLESRIMLDMVMLFAALFINASVASYNTSSSHVEVNAAPVAALAAIVAAGVAAGYGCYRMAPAARRLWRRIKGGDGDF
ncbi:MAG: hypothetical protein K2N21_05470 [Rikenellaceae bacterium]|nr:hypothetical protein [Rikenellaceae bacterium]